MGNTNSAAKGDSGQTSSAGTIHAPAPPRASTTSSRSAAAAAAAAGGPRGSEAAAAAAAAGGPVAASSAGRAWAAAAPGAGRKHGGQAVYHSKRSLEFPDFNRPAHMTPVQRVPSVLPSAPIPIPMGAAVAGQRPVGVTTVRPIDHGSDSMQDLVRPRGGGGQDYANNGNANSDTNNNNNSNNNNNNGNTGNNGTLATADSGAFFDSSAPRVPQQQQPMPRPAALRAGDSARSGSSLGFGARGPRGKITAQTVHVTEAVEVVQSSVPLGIASGDVKLGAREPGASQIEIPTLITWTPDKSHPAPAVASPKLRDSNALPDVWAKDPHNGLTRLTYNPERRIWSETILLPVGNMSVQFVVDGEPHLTTDLPLAPEEDGTLVNYITVISPTPVEGDAGARENANTPLLHSASRWLKEPGTPDDPSGSSPPWTSDIPEHLINAQQEEEVWEGYKAMTAEQRRAAPVPPAPILPSAPLLPRHLDRPLLNTKSKKAAAANSSTLASHAAAGPGRKSGKDKKGASGSGSGSGGRKGERERNYGPSPLSQDPTGRIGLDPALGLTSAASAGAILVEAPHGDDDAVLPVPSHVVLLHLGTSAIRDGVIAVCDTVRYKRKYITTVFYKPMYTAPDPDAMPDPSVIQPPPVPTLQQPPPGASSPVIAAEA